jgi:hypothetical protein
MRCGLFNGITCGDRFAGLLPATQAEMPRWRQPVGQDSVGLPAWMTDSAPHPDAFVSVIVGLPESPAVADDRVALASRTPSWQKVQRDIVFRVKQCDKENHGWREGPPLNVPCQSSVCWPGLHPPGKSVSNKKEYCFSDQDAETHSPHWPVISRHSEVDGPLKLTGNARC